MTVKIMSLNRWSLLTDDGGTAASNQSFSRGPDQPINLPRPDEVYG